MKTYTPKTPGYLKKLGPGLLWSVPTGKKEIYLTFDDGPHPEITGWVLEELKKYKAKATFFCVGENVKRFPGQVKHIVSDGHLIGNHTHNHLNGWKTPVSTYLENIERAENSIREVTNNSSGLFRPPYGKIRPSQIRKVKKQGIRIVMWDVISGDFDERIDAEECIKNVIENSRNGSIIVFHDSEKAFKRLRDTLPEVLRYFAQKGYSFGTLKDR